MTGRVKALEMCQLHHLGLFRHILKCLLLLLIQKDILCCPSVCQQCKGRQADCHNSGLSSIPSNFPQNTVFLYLSGNNISHINPNELIGLHELAVLRLDNCGILYVCPKAFAEFKKLWFLHLNNNQIRHLFHGTFEGLSNLHSLYLHNNEIAFVPRGLFSDLTSVQYLMLQTNRLSILDSDTFFGMISLQVLNLANNNISQISHTAFHHLDNLLCLFLGGNNLTQVPSNAFLALRNLKKLSLSLNPIGSVPPFAFKGLDKLEFLSLKSANIKIINANGFSGLKNLKKLILSNNNLENITSKTFATLENLMFLHLDRNKIINIAESTFQKIGSSLKILNLAFNNLTFLQAETLKPLISLTHLQANYNPWNCSCRLLGLIKWLASSSISLKVRCEYPSNLRGRHLNYAKWGLFTTCFSTTTRPDRVNNTKPVGIHHIATTLLMAWHKAPTNKKAYEHLNVDTNATVPLWTELPTTAVSQELYEEYSSGKLGQAASVLTAQIPAQKIRVNLTIEENSASPPEAVSISFKTSLICTEEVKKLNHAFDILLTFFILACAVIIFLMYKIILFRQKLKVQKNPDSGIEYYSFYQAGSYTITDPIQPVPPNLLGSQELGHAQLSKPAALESQAQVILFEHSLL
ncbi:leucine-rich repeat-containing protein 70 [Sceloporus undulatus]|uniref:leucine-rich repeat-containing protein 70 n=1 Tax=Sceloporus undulatus TaxID=8520 RepID=UPI001C4D7B8B|nr:leucine-rich repeat-containing protein 70 [Sceloporus undulatus]